MQIEAASTHKSKKSAGSQEIKETELIEKSFQVKKEGSEKSVESSNSPDEPASKKIRKTYEKQGWMVDEGSSEDDFDYGQKEDPKKDWKIEKLSKKDTKKQTGRDRQLINRKTRGFVVTEMIMNDLKRETAAAKKRRREQRVAAEDENPQPEQKLTGREKRAEYNAKKIKRIGTHYYETANVKNRNRDRVKTADPELGNRGHMKKKPTNGK